MSKNVFKLGWKQTFASLNKLSEFEKGKYFEELTYLVLTTKPVYTSLLNNVWIHGKGMPSSISKKLNLPRTDEGIDLIAETFSGEYWAIQCKFKGANQSPTYKELSTFTHLAHTHCKNISMALLVHTGERGVRKKHLLGDKYSEIGLELTEDDWQRIWLKKAKKAVIPQKRLPKPHQKNAISSAHSHFIEKSNSRGRLIMPCGTGKSLTAFWIANKVKAKSVIVAVPSLNLIKQSLEDWTNEFSAIGEQDKVNWKIICSDESVGGVEGDEFITDTTSLGVPTTDVNELVKFLKKPSTGKKVVFTTYQSSQRLAAAAKKSKFTFDFAILDEAHKTVGEKSKAFATLLSDKNIKIRKRMFMTATERVLRGKNDDVHSMDDVAVYGERFYQLTFKEAIHSKPGIISDYKILTIAVTNSQINEVLQKNPLLIDKRGKISHQEAQSLAAAIALRQATKKYGIKHAISFHRSIKTADKFASLHQELNAKRANGINLTSFHISSKKSTGERSNLIDEFKNESLALMTNARCLTEGVNIPAIDCVLFADPKQSVVDIVQAAGRALRVSKGKKYGYIMMPVVVPHNMSIEEFTETTSFKQVSRVIIALSTQDETIAEELKLINEKSRGNQKGKIQFKVTDDKSLKIDINKLKRNIEIKLWERVAKINFRTYTESVAFTSQLGLKNVKEWALYSASEKRPFDIPAKPYNTYFKEWEGWNNWLGIKNESNWEISKNSFSYDEAKSFLKNECKGTINSIGLFNKWKSNKLKSVPPFPNKMPKAPISTYLRSGEWVSSYDFFGKKNERKAKTSKRYDFIMPKISYKDLKNIIRKQNLNSRNEYIKWLKRIGANKVKEGYYAPVFPDRSYKIEFEGWSIFLNTKNIRSISRSGQKFQFLGFKNARDFARKLKLKSKNEWSQYCKNVKNKSLKLPFNIPKAPDKKFKNEGWKGWADFLGKK